MGSNLIRLFITFLFCLCLSSGSLGAELGPPETIQEKETAESQESEIFFSPAASGTQLDTVPIVNPTTPGMGNTTPIVNPTGSPPTPGMGTTTPPGMGNTAPVVNPAGSSPTPPGMGNTAPVVNPGGSSPTPPGMGNTAPVVNPAGSSPTPPDMGNTSPIVNPTGSPPVPALPKTQPNPVSTPTTSSGGAWCIANPSASDTALQVALDYACGYGGTDCSPIQPGASCYDPNTVRDHASYAFNDFYQKNPVETSCAFGGTAQLTHTDPSHGNCHYASSKAATSSTSPPATPTPSTATPITTTPATATQPTFTPPSVYSAAEPTGVPSSATDIFCRLQVAFSAIGVYGLLLATNQI